MGNDLISPEIMLLDKLEETDSHLSPVVWEQMRNEVAVVEETERCHLPVPVQQKIKMFFSDYVNKAISLPMEITPEVSDEARKQIFRLYLFSCQQAIHNFEVRRNPLILGFHALRDLKLALTAILVSYRLITPSCPYSWSREFFERNIFVDKGSDGHAVVNIKGIDATTVNEAINADIVTDWLIYRAYDANGIRTLMDIKNNLLTLPDYKRGGHPAAEFSRFERKMAEERSRKEGRKNEALDLEFRKTLVRAVAEQTADKMVNSGMSATDILAQAYNAKLDDLANNTTLQPVSEKQTVKSGQPSSVLKKTGQTLMIDEVIQKLLEE